jgi:hypothetical protein
MELDRLDLAISVNQSRLQDGWRGVETTVVWLSLIFVTLREVFKLSFRMRQLLVR